MEGSHCNYPQTLTHHKSCGVHVVRIGAGGGCASSHLGWASTTRDVAESPFGQHSSRVGAVCFTSVLRALRAQLLSARLLSRCPLLCHSSFSLLEPLKSAAGFWILVPGALPPGSKEWGTQTRKKWAKWSSFASRSRNVLLHPEWPVLQRVASLKGCWLWAASQDCLACSGNVP